jgi:hypothetical protein
MARFKFARGLKNGAFLLVGLVGLLLVFSGAARADFYPGIDTTDSDISDWAEVFANGEFWTDPPGDVTNPDEDWIKAWVSQTGTSDTDRVHFLMEILGPNVLINEERAAVALLDCNQDGLMTENDDAVIAYDWFNGSVPDGWDDMVVVCDGELQKCLATGDRTLGQKFTYTETGEPDRYFVEWGIPFDQIPPNSEFTTQICKDSNPEDEVDKLINIEFQTAISTYQAPAPIDEADSSTGYNITTVIDLNNFNAQSSSFSSLPLLLAGGAMIVVGFGGFILVRRKKS